MFKGERFLICPDCRKRGVYFALGHPDSYDCRYCRWGCIAEDWDENLLNLSACNPAINDTPVVFVSRSRPRSRKLGY